MAWHLMSGATVAAESDAEPVYDAAQKGWRVGNMIVVDPERAMTVVDQAAPAVISMRQAITQAAIAAWITPAEAEGWAMGNALPALVASVIAALPEPYRLPAKIKALRAVEVERGDPLMLAAATAALNGEGDVGETLDEFFRAAALL